MNVWKEPSFLDEENPQPGKMEWYTGGSGPVVHTSRTVVFYHGKPVFKMCKDDPRHIEIMNYILHLIKKDREERNIGNGI